MFLGIITCQHTRHNTVTGLPSIRVLSQNYRYWSYMVWSDYSWDSSVLTASTEWVSSGNPSPQVLNRRKHGRVAISHKTRCGFYLV